MASAATGRRVQLNKTRVFYRFDYKHTFASKIISKNKNRRTKPEFSST